MRDWDLLTMIPLKRGSPSHYDQWIQGAEIQLSSRINQSEMAEFGRDPLISIILPVYEVRGEFLRATLASILSQTYINWQLCIAFGDPNGAENLAYVNDLASSDPRIDVIILESNHGISANSNHALALAKGEFIALVDHDDEIPPYALGHIASVICSSPEVDFIYSDKDCLSEDGGTRLSPLFKPEWSPEILYSVNYLTHLCAIRKSLVVELGGFCPETDGAQGWDLFLRVAERARLIRHIPSIDYHWRVHSGSSSVSLDSKPYAPQAQERSLNDHLQRCQLKAVAIPHPQCGFHIQWESDPLAPIQLHTLLIANGSDQPEEIEEIDGIGFFADHGLLDGQGMVHSSSHVVSERSWNSSTYSSLNDKILPLLARGDGMGGAGSKEREVLLIVSSSIVDLNPFVINEIVAWPANHKSIGFCGGLVIGEEHSFLDAGLVLDDRCAPISLYGGLNIAEPSLFPSPLWYRNWRAVTPSFVAVKAAAFAGSGGFQSSDSMLQSFVSLCCEIARSGYRGMTNPHAKVISKRTDALEALLRFESDASISGDPFFNAQLSVGWPSGIGFAD